MGQCSKIMFAHPRNPRADFLYNLRAVTYFEDVELDGLAASLDSTSSSHSDSHDARSRMLRPLLFSLAILHTAMRSCLVSGAVKENERLEHGVADLTSALAMALFLWGADNYQDTHAFANPMLLPWPSFRTIISRMNLGALVTDPWEERLFRLQLSRALPWTPPADGEAFGSSMRAAGFSHVESRIDFRRIAELATGDLSFLDIEQQVVDMWEPEGFLTRDMSGLAHQALEQADAHHLQKCLGDLRFVRRKREINRHDKAKMTLDEINERLPKTLQVPPPREAGGEQSPFYQVYVGEIASMNVLLTTMSHSLLQLELALEGQTRVSMDLEMLIDAFCHDIVPAQWLKVSHPSGRSLGGWFNDMVQRCDLLHDWCASRVLPPVVWLSGLCHPEAFIAAVIIHHSLVNRWPLSETVLCPCSRAGVSSCACGCFRIMSSLAALLQPIPHTPASAVSTPSPINLAGVDGVGAGARHRGVAALPRRVRWRRGRGSNRRPSARLLPRQGDLPVRCAFALPNCGSSSWGWLCQAGFTIGLTSRLGRRHGTCRGVSSTVCHQEIPAARKCPSCSSRSFSPSDGFEQTQRAPAGRRALDLCFGCCAYSRGSWQGVRQARPDGDVGGWQSMHLSAGGLRQAFDCPPPTTEMETEDGDLRVAVPVYRTQKKMGPVVMRALLPATGENETWILLGVTILMDPYVYG
jgi:hypothetical protein